MALMIVLVLLAELTSVFFLTVNGTNSFECLHVCTSKPQCTTLEYIANGMEVKDDVTICLEAQVISVSTLLLFDGWSNFTLQGQGATINCSIVGKGGRNNEAASAGFYFNNCQGITLCNVTLTQCSIEDSFSETFYSEYKFRSGLIIKNTSRIYMSHVVVTNSDGYGAVLINNYEEIDITSSNFMRNNLMESYDNGTIGGSGMMILVSKCNIGEAKECTNSTLTNGARYNINSVVFESNIHRKSELYNFFFSYGGGLNIILTRNSVGQIFNIVNTNFSFNTAVCGGGLGLFLGDGTSHNEILMQDCSFIGNNATKDFGVFEGGGGGMKLCLYQEDEDNGLQYNNIKCIRCTFTGNRAVYGSGMALEIGFSGKSEAGTTKIYFKDSFWYWNKGIVSAAVDISGHVQRNFNFGYFATSFLSSPEFENCRFTLNGVPDEISNLFRDQLNVYDGIATFLISRLHVAFRGNNFFTDNYLTGLYLESAGVFIRNNSSMLFFNNRGYKAGGITAESFSVIRYGDNVVFRFANNQGSIGFEGAIYANSFDPHFFFSSHMCFLQSAKGNASNVTFHFYRNAIFVSSLHPCRAACNGMTDNPFNNSCLGNFYYLNNVLVNVTTEAATAVLRTSDNEVVDFIPGIVIQMPVTFTDELHQDVTANTIYYPLIAKGHKLTGKIDTSLNIVGNNRLAINGQPGLRGTLRLRVQGYRQLETVLFYKLSPCPPGYVIDTSYKCHCSATLDSEQWYNGVLGCNETDTSIFLLPDWWLGYIGNDTDIPDRENKLYTGQCPPGYCNMSFRAEGFLNGQFYQLKFGPSQTALSEIMCNNGREGILCGQCKKGTSTYLHSDNFVCRSDSEYCHFGILFYILSELLPLTFLFVLVFYYNISFTKGPAYSIVFFVQQLHIMELSIHGIMQFRNNGLIQIINFFYSMLNLQFFAADVFSFCLWKGATTMDILLMRLVSVAYALCLLLLLVLLANKCGRCMRHCKRNNSMVHGLTAFIVICYSEATHVSFNILNYEALIGKGGKKYPQMIVFYNGELSYFSKGHLLYAVPALLVVVFIILPTPLCLICDPILLKIEDNINVFKHVKPWTRLRERFKPLLDSFQSCFKDKFRFFAGLFFLYRTTILANLLIFSNNMQYLFVNEVILVIIFGVQAVVQPFEAPCDNVISSLVLLALLIINTLGINDNIYIGNKHYIKEVAVLQYFQILLVCLPLFIALAWALKLLFRKCLQCKRNYSVNSISEAEVSLIYNRNEDVIRYGSVSDGYDNN